MIKHGTKVFFSTILGLLFISLLGTTGAFNDLNPWLHLRGLTLLAGAILLSGFICYVISVALSYLAVESGDDFFEYLSFVFRPVGLGTITWIAVGSWLWSVLERLGLFIG